VRILASRPDAAVDYTAANLTGAAAIVLGSEANGLSEAWSGDDVAVVKLPMHGIADSLNVSTTAAVLFYEARRQRRVLPG
jgi:TrmH family RNA methyltransferase